MRMFVRVVFVSLVALAQIPSVAVPGQASVTSPPQVTTAVVLDDARDIVSHPLLVPLGSVTTADGSGSFYCEADANAGFEGYTNDGDFDMFVTVKCHGVTAVTMKAHAALQTYSGHVADYYPMGYGTNLGKDCSNTVVCGDSKTNWACGPCDGTWSYHAIVDVVVPDNYYFSSASGDCYLTSAHEAGCDATGYVNVSNN